MPRKPTTEQKQSVTRLLYRANEYRAQPISMVKAKTSVRIAMETVDFKSNVISKNDQSWKYKGGLVDRAPSVMLGGAHLYDHKVDSTGTKVPRRSQESNFFLTINPNLAPRSVDDVYKVTAAVETMAKELGTDTGVANILKYGPKNPEVYGADLYAQVISGIEWKAGVEMGGVAGRTHMHAWLTVTHYSQVQIDVHKLQYLARHLYNEAYAGNDVSFPAASELTKRRHMRSDDKFVITKLPYVHVRLLPQSNWTSIMRSYIQKGMSV